MHTARSLILLASVVTTLPMMAQTAAPTMKAAVVHEHGGPEVLKFEDAPRPEAHDDQVLIRVMAAAVNPVDAAIRAGRFTRAGDKLPMIPGMDVAGVVETVGAKITEFKAGDPVYAFLSFKEQGGYAEFAIASQNEMSIKPKTVTFEQAAAVPLAATTAWQALVDTAKIRPGQTVLIHGGSGGVGSFAIQIAKAKGAKVIATASTPNQALLKELGADQSIDYTTTKFEEVVKDVDVVLDAVGKDTLARSPAVVKKGGIIVSIAGQSDAAELEKRGIRGTTLMAHPDARVLQELATLIDGGKIKVVVSEVLPLAEAAKAHEQIATRHTRGKIVLRVAPDKQ